MCTAAKTIAPILQDSEAFMHFSSAGHPIEASVHVCVVDSLMISNRDKQHYFKRRLGTIAWCDLVQGVDGLNAISRKPEPREPLKRMKPFGYAFMYLSKLVSYHSQLVLHGASRKVLACLVPKYVTETPPYNLS